MSVDLFVVRKVPIAWRDCLRACNALSRQHEGLTFWSMVSNSTNTSAYFWHVGRVSLSAAAPEPEDVAEDDPPELTHPYIVVSSRSGAWPWIEWMAFALGNELGARVFDPQNGDFNHATVPEHDIAALRRQHDAWLREAKP